MIPHRLFFSIIAIAWLAACAAAPGSAPPSAAYDPAADIDLFLNTKDDAVESQVLRRLQNNRVAHDDIRRLLAAPRAVMPGPAGLHSGRQFPLRGKSYPYALYAPPAPADAALPLIIILHGMGGSGPGIIGQWMARLQDKFIIICPSYPMGAWWTQAAEDLTLGLIRAAQDEYPVDRDRVFIAGVSNGAIGAFMTGMFHPDRFAGIVPIAGVITERYMHFLVSLSNTPVYMIQGKHDPMFPIAYSRRVHKILTDMKYPVVFREHEEVGQAHGGHFLPETEIPALVEWLHKQKRKTQPKLVRMTREANHLQPIHWAGIVQGTDLAALQLPGPEKEDLRVRDGKIATLFATLKDGNKIEVMCKDLLEYDLYLDARTTDFSNPVYVTTQILNDTGGKLVPSEPVLSHAQRVDKDPAVLLRSFKARRDPELLYDAVIRVSLEKRIELAWRQ